jgi:CRP-like cAMP-binding protein
MIESPEILRLIETAPLFRGIPRELLEPIFRKGKLVTLKPDEKLLSPGIFNEYVYIIISGRLSVQALPSLTVKPIATLTSGECIGEMSVLVDSLVAAYVIATTSCELFAMDYISFWSLIDSSSESERNMLNIMVRRIRLCNEVMADRLLHYVNPRQ